MFLTPLFHLMAEKQASDLFFTAGAPICIKISGNVMPINTQVLDAATVRKVAWEIMTEAQVKAFEQTLEMNFSYGVREVGSFRVNVFQQRGAVGMVIRHVKNRIPSIADLRLPPSIGELILEKRGLVLIVGSTGSGKSSTLAAMIDYRNQSRGGHILTIEDPIEYNFKHKKSIINQREVGMDTHSYSNALVSAMREAPDVLMIGEIRDRETLQHAITYAQTGHLCISTLHANNSYHALNRIVTLFPHESRASLLMDLSMTLRAVVSQRLLKAKDGSLVPAVEALLNTMSIQELIKKGEFDQIREMMEQSMSPGSQTFERSLYKLFSTGLVTQEEALANSDSPTNLAWLINNARGQPASPGLDITQPIPAPPARTSAGAPSKVPVRTEGSDLGSFKFNMDVV
ncbi:MAG: PilT/PilU family type 4a pilus ATPase [bacterium]|jgi:twitching motility protein PilU|nr:PilT/PilU family type 4a pilus ATPase [Betaproteobacteria bacterium]